MESVIITLIAVICYKAKKGFIEKEIIKFTRIFGTICLSIEIILQILTIILIQDKIIASIFGIVIETTLIIIINNLKKITEKIMYKEDNWR